MQKALYTSISRAELVAADVLAGATRLPGDPTEDKFEIGGCRISCRYWSRGGDTVSRQILGCFNAIRIGKLECADKDAAMARVSKAKPEIGIVGSDEEVEELANILATRFGGVIISPTDARLVG
jgi:hypothetical protein